MSRRTQTYQERRHRESAQQQLVEVSIGVVETESLLFTEEVLESFRYLRLLEMEKTLLKSRVFNMEESYRVGRLLEIEKELYERARYDSPAIRKLTLEQEGDCCNSEPQELEITLEDGGGGAYLVFKTDRWAVDLDEMPSFLEKLTLLVKQYDDMTAQRYPNSKILDFRTPT